METLSLAVPYVDEIVCSSHPGAFFYAGIRCEYLIR